MPPPSLEQLFATFLATGDEATLEQLQRRSAPPLRRLARRLGADAEDTEDLLQETLVAAIDGAERFDPTRPLLPWLKGILTFRAAKLARGRFRRRRLAAPWPAAEPAAETATASPASQAAGRELAADVHDAIAQLPPPYRAPLHAFLVGGHSPVEIAQRLGEARATVRVRLHRGLQRLRRTLARWASLGLALWIGRPAHAAPSRSFARLAVAMALVALPVAIAAWAWRAPAPPATAAVEAPAALPGERAAADGPQHVVRQAADPPTHATSAPALVALVVDPSGTPVPHVGVTFTPLDGRDPVANRRRAVTGAEGRASATVPTTAGVLVATDRGVACTVPPSTTGPVRLVLAAGRSVHGRVTDADDRPVAGAAVWLAADDTGPWRGGDVTTTSADGAFRLDHVAPGSCLAARHPTLARSDVVRLPDGTDPLTLRLHAAGGRARVQVRTPDGAPGANALVFVGEAMEAASLQLAQGAAPWRAPPFEGRTDADGWFCSGALPPGRHPLFVRAAGAVPCRAHVDVPPDGDGTTVVALRAAGTITGTLTDALGMPLGGGEVVLRSGDPTHSVDVTTDAAGRFAFDGVPPGVVDVAARAAGHAPRVVAVRADLARALALPLALAPLAPLRGTLRRGDGGPTAGAALRGEWPASALFAASQIAAIAADGTFTFAAAPPGQPRLSVRLPDEPLWRPVDAATVWQPPDVHVELPADFAGDAFLAGTLRDEHGDPIARARLFVRSATQPWAEIGRTDDDGAYTLGPLPAGTWTLFAESTSAELPTLHHDGLVLAPGGHTRSDAMAPPCGRVAIELVRADGAAVGDVVATLVDRRLQRRCAVATSPRLDQVLVPGDYLLAVMGSRVRWLDDVPVTVTAGTTTTLRLELVPAARCTLSLAGLPEGPRPAPLHLQLHDVQRTWSATYTLAPDAPLRLAAVLAPGQYELEHVDADGRRWLGTFACSDEAAAANALLVQLAAR